MTKNITIIKILLLLLFVGCSMFICFNFLKYIINYIHLKPTGKDTVVIFGDATYQILKGTNLKGEREYSLYKYHNGIILEYVYKYYDDKKNNKAYFIGKNISDDSFYYVIVDYLLMNEKLYYCDKLIDEYYKIFFEDEGKFVDLNSYYNNSAIEC